MAHDSADALKKVGGSDARTTWIESGRAQSRCSFLKDLWETGTTYHQEPVAIKLHVGWPGYLGLAGRVAIVAYVLHQLVTINVYLDEIEPNNKFSHWAEGDLESVANTQWVDTSNSSLCTYSKKWDYKYGLDSVWDYSANTCQFVSLDEIALKSARSIHFVTYQHNRQRVLINKTGRSCDEECQSVYAEWPSSASYNTSKFASAYINTELDALLRVQHPTISKSPNVHLMKPASFGLGMCECWSNQNVINLGVDAATFVFTHNYDSKHMSGSSQGSGPNDPTSFLLGYGKPKPFKIFAKGKQNEFTVAEVVSAVGTCLDCQPNGTFYMNSICNGGVCPQPFQPKPVPRISGMAIDLETEYYNDRKTMPKTAAYKWITDNHEPPYAVHVLRRTEDWTSLGAKLTTRKTPTGKVDTNTYRYGVLIRIGASKGKISKFDFNVVLNWIVNATVLLAFPGMAVSFIVFNLLQPRSALYLKAQRKLLTVENMWKQFAFSALLANFFFEKVDSNGSGIIEAKELKHAFITLLRPRMLAKHPGKMEWATERINMFVDKLLARDYHPEDEDGNPVMTTTKTGISHSAFIKACTFSEAFDWEDLIDKVEDPDSDLGPVQKLAKFFSSKEGSRPKVVPA